MLCEVLRKKFKLLHSPMDNIISPKVFLVILLHSFELVQFTPCWILDFNPLKMLKIKANTS
jgi:hypothetical protein